MRLDVFLISLTLNAMTDPVEVRAKLSDYPFQMRLDKADIGVDYLGHTLPVAKEPTKSPLFAPDHLIVEIAVFPSPFAKMEISSSNFALRLNGKKIVAAQSAGMVVRSIQGSGQRQRSIGFGGGGAGQPPFPGPGGPGGYPQPRRSPIPEEERPGVEKEPEAKLEEVVPARELQSGVTGVPVAGYLYFPYEGKLKALKSIELLYESPAGKGKVSLQ